MHPTPAPCAPNARFWMLVNQYPVKLTLRPGQERCWHHTCKAREDGRHAGLQFSRTWLYDGRRVLCTTQVDGRDGDGRLRTLLQLSCPTDRLASRTIEFFAVNQDDEQIRFPAWKNLDEVTWDDQAIAAGY